MPTEEESVCCREAKINKDIMKGGNFFLFMDFNFFFKIYVVSVTISSRFFDFREADFGYSTADPVGCYPV